MHTSNLQDAKREEKLQKEILEKIIELDVANDPLIYIALKIGGLKKHPIYRIYSKIGTKSTFKKMQKMAEYDLANRLIKELKETIFL